MLRFTLDKYLNDSRFYLYDIYWLMSEHDEKLHYFADQKDGMTRMAIQKGKDVIMFGLEEAEEVAEKLVEPYKTEFKYVYEDILWRKRERRGIWA